jgi:hypothetical protein
MNVSSFKGKWNIAVVHCGIVYGRTTLSTLSQKMNMNDIFTKENIVHGGKSVMVLSYPCGKVSFGYLKEKIEIAEGR